MLVGPSPVLRKASMNARGVVELGGQTVAALRPMMRMLDREQPDLLYVSTVTVPVWLTAARLRGVPVVCHVHEAESTASLAVKRALAAPLFLTDRIIVNSRFSSLVIKDAFPALERRASVVYNGVTGPASVVPPRLNCESPIRLVYVGRLSERKGVDVAVSAVGLLRDQGLPATLDIVGSQFAGHDGVFDRLRAQVAALGLQDAVTFSGFVPKAWDHVAAADIVLVPSRVDEPFGNTAVEGVLAARPVIASEIGGLVEAVAGLPSATSVEPGSPDAIAAAVRHVVGNWSTYREQALQDAVTAHGRHSVQSYRDLMVEILVSTIDIAEEAAS